MAKITVSQDAAGDDVFTKEDTALQDYIVAPITGLFGNFTSDESKVFHDEASVGIMALGFMAGGVFVGDRYGDSIPILGQGR